MKMDTIHLQVVHRSRSTTRIDPERKQKAPKFLGRTFPFPFHLGHLLLQSAQVNNSSPDPLLPPWTLTLVATSCDSTPYGALPVIRNSQPPANLDIALITAAAAFHLSRIPHHHHHGRHCKGGTSAGCRDKARATRRGDVQEESCKGRGRAAKGARESGETCHF